jgi:hypothetical protein
MACALTVPGLASAGVYTDDMSKCLVSSANEADQAQLVAWIFSAISSHPAVRPMTNLTDAQRRASTDKAGLLMQRLMLIDCRPQTVNALKYEGMASIGQAFGVLGQVAMRGLMSDPTVSKGIAGLGDNLDEAKFNAMFKEAGITPPAAK